MEIKSKKMVELLTKKKELIEKVKSITEEMEVLDKDRRKIALQVQKIKDKVVPEVRNKVYPTLGDFEEVESFDVKKGSDEIIEVKILNRIDEFKEVYLSEKKKKLAEEDAKYGKIK